MSALVDAAERARLRAELVSRLPERETPETILEALPVMQAIWTLDLLSARDAIADRIHQAEARCASPPPP